MKVMTALLSILNIVKIWPRYLSGMLFCCNREYVYLWNFQNVTRMKRFVYLIGLLILALACKETFEAPPQSMLVGSFYNSATNKEISPVTTAQGVDNPVVLWGDTAISKILLPLTFKDTTRYILWLDASADSLILVHQATRKYASIETGFYYEYKLLSVRFTQNRIDSVRITDSLVTKKWNENIKLYIHPLPNSGN